MDQLQETPPVARTWTRWILPALFLSLAAHALFVWWARQYPVPTFGQSRREAAAPRTFKMQRVAVDSPLPEDTPAPAEDARKTAPAPVDLPREDIAADTADALPAAPPKPAQLDIGKEPLPAPASPAAGSANLAAVAAESLALDLYSMRDALLAENPTASAQPALALASSAGRAGGSDAVPAGYSDLDELLSKSGGLSPSQAPIFMPSDVLFGYNESFLRPEAIVSLGKLGELIRRNPKSKFRIEGHTDSFGGPEYNAKLSLARAESVKQWLAGTMSIDPSRIETRGLGNSKPLAPATGTIDEQQLNRRVEIVIMRGDDGR